MKESNPNSSGVMKIFGISKAWGFLTKYKSHRQKEENKEVVRKNFVKIPMHRDRNPETTLLGCPGEIRNHIYSYLFAPQTTQQTLETLQFDRALNPNTSIRLACRQLYQETCGMARPSFLMVPKHEYFRVKTCAGLTMPINDYHKEHMMYGSTPTESIKNLFLRDYLHNIILYWRPPVGESFHKFVLRPQIIYIQLCICSALYWFETNPQLIATFARAMEQMLNTYSSITRVVIYFCGQAVGYGFPSIFDERAQIPFPRLVAEGVLSDSLIPSHTDSGWVVLNVDETVSSFMLAPVEGNGNEKRVVQMDFFDSRNLCGKHCVLA